MVDARDFDTGIPPDRGLIFPCPSGDDCQGHMYQRGGFEGAVFVYRSSSILDGEYANADTDGPVWQLLSSEGVRVANACKLLHGEGIDGAKSLMTVAAVPVVIVWVVFLFSFFS